MEENTVLALLTGFIADGSVTPQPEKFFLRKDREVKQQQLHRSALNTALAFDLYRDLATRTTAEPNILFSPLGLASALALLSQVSGSASRSQALKALGLAANSTEQSVEATISALTDLQHNLTLQEMSGGGSEATAGVAPDAGNKTGGEDGAVGGTGTEDGAHAGVPRSFQLNATTKLEVPMMLRDDSSEVMMLYDTNCSATVVRLAHSKRLASLLLLPKSELQPLEECLRAEIRFPKFQLRKSYSLENLLRNSGVTSVFSDSADFSGLLSKKTLQLIKAPHVVTLEVEESKSVDGRRPDIMLDFSVPQRITFDRPFMLIIYEELTELVLIMGRVIDPTDV
ncbi:hypothetical protein INR49_004413 [Caranx melampygus]|nr:hypothetical protein INR49_004413 [Caranx melampygus]